MRIAPKIAGFQKLQHVRSMTTPMIKGLRPAVSFSLIPLMAAKQLKHGNQINATTARRSIRAIIQWKKPLYFPKENSPPKQNREAR